MDKTLELASFKLDKSKWNLTLLGDLATEISKRVDNPSESAYERFVGLEHFVSGELALQNWGTTEGLVSSTKAFEKGDILFARRNAYLRRASLVEFDGVCSGDAFVLRENQKKLVPGFLAFIVNASSLWRFANANAAGTMSKRVKWRDLADFKLLLPPKEDQEKLSELIWSLNLNLARKKQLSLKQDSLFLSTLKAHFNQSFDNYSLLGDCGDWQSGGTPSKKNESYWGGEIPWVSPKDMKTEVISSSIDKITQVALDDGAKYLPENTILMVVRGMILAHSFPVAITANKVSFNQDMKALIVNSDYRPEYVLYFLQFMKRDILGMVTTTTHGTKRLASDALFELKVPKPSLDEQDKIIRNIKLQKDSMMLNDQVSRDTKLLISNIIDQVL